MSHITEIQSIEDARGTMHVVQTGKDVPFPIARFFYITEVPEGGKRGFHAHKRENEYCICLQGSCNFLLDDGRVRNEHVLDAPDKLLHIPRMHWVEMTNFSRDCILLVVSDILYDPEERIDDYDEFKLLAGKNGNQNQTK